MKGYGPAEPPDAPKFAGVSTFLRLPYATDLSGVDVAVVGLPFDVGMAVRAGARFGPRAVREGSLAIRPHFNPAQRVSVFDHVSAVDHGDLPVKLGFTDRSLRALQEGLHTVHAAGAVPLGLGGDRTVLLAELRAAVERHGPLALLHFGAHTDTCDEVVGERHAPGTVVRRAVEEGLIDPERSTLLGMRGGVAAPDEYEQAGALGFTVLPWPDLAQLGTGAVAAAVDLAAGPAFVTVDADFVDPAFAPGTDSPEVGGPTSMQALALLRACRGVELAGADVVAVVPELDSSNLTAYLAATLAYELLTLIACGRLREAG